jgi:hypothetical protein
MMRTLGLMLLLCLPAPAAAFVTDAFGVHEAADASRAAWSGLSEEIADGAVQPRWVAPGPGRTVLFLLGAKSLTAGGAAGQAAALVLDGQGNLVADGTAVSLTLGPAVAGVTTRRGIAASPLRPGRVAGQFHAGAAIAGQQGGRVEYVVQPDLASVPPVIAPPPEALAEDFGLIATTPLYDRFGNAVADGTGLRLTLAHPDGAATLLDAVAVGGVAQGRLLARDVPPDAMVTATLGPRTSAPVAFAVTALAPLGDLAMATEDLPDIAATRLVVGPFLTTAGHALNDGAPVSLTVALADGRILQESGWVLDGRLDAVLLVGETGFPLQVTVRSALGSVTQTLSHGGAAP